jgi:hypothetical protein
VLFAAILRAHPFRGMDNISRFLSDFLAEHLSLDIVIVAILRFILLQSAAFPAIWSRCPERRRDAREVLRLLSKSRSDTESSRELRVGTQIRHRCTPEPGHGSGSGKPREKLHTNIQKLGTKDR